MTELNPKAVATQKLSFYQKGTFTVGNRLVCDAQLRRAGGELCL